MPKWVSEPTVTLVGATVYFDEAVEKWCKERNIDYSTDAVHDADAMAELGGRVCYLSLNEELRRKSGDGQNQAYLDHIREVGHGSVWEHASFNFLIDGLSKHVTQELVRHRVGTAISCQSSRYVDPYETKYFRGQDENSFHVPAEIQSDPELVKLWSEALASAEAAYKRSCAKLRERGYAVKDARSVARHVIPGGVTNALLWSCNARELRHVFSLRGALAADPEIRTLAIKMFRHVKDVTIFKDIWEGTENGQPVLKFAKATVLPTLTDELKRLDEVYGEKALADHFAEYYR